MLLADLGKKPNPDGKRTVEKLLDSRKTGVDKAVDAGYQDRTWA